jgi:ribose transport system permease protein
MTEIKTGGTHLGLANWVQEIITGVIIIVAVALDRLRHRKGLGARGWGPGTLDSGVRRNDV